MFRRKVIKSGQLTHIFIKYLLCAGTGQAGRGDGGPRPRCSRRTWLGGGAAFT